MDPVENVSLVLLVSIPLQRQGISARTVKSRDARAAPVRPSVMNVSVLHIRVQAMGADVSLRISEMSAKSI